MEDNEISKDWNKMSRDMFKEGFREGASKGKEIEFQKGFDQGYEEGFKIGQRLGHTKGILKILNKYEQDQEINSPSFKNQIENPSLGNCLICEEEKKSQPLLNFELINQQKITNQRNIEELNRLTVNILKNKE